MPKSTGSDRSPVRGIRVAFLLIGVLAVCLLVPRLREWAWVFVILLLVTPFGGFLVERLRQRR
ncbi:hypothetical protein [Pengzhenrongella phosphoraccumulans]|jgi:hypothetical protein|uniref:hypothetical protein n=1 Tax=Pengzhenrongella phosphoraccumulans TaxID=3114394 RepID=UPI00388E6378